MFLRIRGSDTTCVLFRGVALRRNIGVLEAHRRTSAWCCPQGEGAAARCGPGFRRPNLAAPVIDITMYVRAVGSSAGPRHRCIEPGGSAGRPFSCAEIAPAYLPLTAGALLLPPPAFCER